MDPNERILRQVLAERYGHSRVEAVRSPWLVLVALILGLAAILSVRAIATRADASQVPLDRRDSVPAASPPESGALERTIPAPAAAPLQVPAGPAQDARRPPARYVVQAGDSLRSIAERNGLRPTTLASINELEDPNLLQPGRELLVPASDGFLHVVRRGETLRVLSERYHVDLAILAAVNNLSDPDRLEDGFHLFVPDRS
jgi:LysM repeat protein